MPNPQISHLVWNRACYVQDQNSRLGDSALAALLLFHGRAMNGGVLHAVSGLTSEQLSAACDGFIYYGFTSIVALINDAKKAVVLDYDLDDFEQELNQRYWHHIPSDAVLSKAFESDFNVRPQNYAPIH